VHLLLLFSPSHSHPFSLPYEQISSPDVVAPLSLLSANGPPQTPPSQPLPRRCTRRRGSPGPAPTPPVGVSPSPARSMLRRFFKRPFPPPSSAKHIKAMLAKRLSGGKPKEGVVCSLDCVRGYLKVTQRCTSELIGECRCCLQVGLGRLNWFHFLLLL
jgi:hypothetical protein